MYLSPIRPKTKLQINAANLDWKIAQRDERKQRIIAVADSASNYTKQVNFRLRRVFQNLRFFFA